MLERLTSGDFSGRIGEEFRVRSGETALVLVLVEVRDLSTGGAAAPRRKPFSLTFRGPAASPLPQRIWPLENDALGRLEIFLVPIGPDGQGLRYEAIFN